MNWKNKKVLVTGASGFIGKNLIIRLLNEGAIVKGIYNKNPIDIQNENLESIKVNLLDRYDVRENIKDVDYMVICAAYVGGAEKLLEEPMKFVTDKTIMDLYSLEAAYLNGIKNIVYIGSGMSYHESNKPLTEDIAMVGEPWDKYFFGGWSRRYSEVVCRMYAEKIDNPINITSVRIDNIYGPYDSYKWEKSHVMAALIRKAVEKMNPFEVWGDGKDYKDFIYVDDVVEGILLALYNVNGFNLYNIASGINYTINEVLDIILKKANYSDVKIIYNNDKPKMIPYKVTSIEKAKKELGFLPKTNIEDGIEKTIEWYLNNYKE